MFTSILFDSLNWNYTWSGSGYYRVVLYGQQIGLTSANTFTYPTLSPIEIVPLGELAASEINPPYLTIGWYGDPSASGYQIQDSSGNVLFNQKENGSANYEWSTPVLEDGSTYTYNVVEINSIGQDSLTPSTLTGTIVTQPDVPSVALSYDGTNINIMEM